MRRTRPSIPVQVRHHFVKHSEDGHPWNAEGWYGLTPEVSWERARDVVTQIHSGAAAILQRLAGVDLQLHSINRIANDSKYYPKFWGNQLIHRRIVGAVWSPGRPYVDVIWLRGRKEYGPSGPAPVYGESFSPAYYRVTAGVNEWVRWEPSSGIVMSSCMATAQELQYLEVLDQILAHELAHHLGLPHTFSALLDDGPAAWSSAARRYFYAPFYDDLPAISTLAEDRNLMDYPWFEAYTEHNTLTNPDKLRLTDSQAQRSRLTAVSRRARFIDFARYPDLADWEDEESMYYGLFAATDPGQTVAMYEAVGLDRTPVLPDHAAAFSARWLD